MPVLTAAQKQRYERDGFLQLSGLLPEDVVMRAAAAMWRTTGADPNDRATWVAVAKRSAEVDDPDLVACYSQRILTAVAELLDDDSADYKMPTSAYQIAVFPTPGRWKAWGPHIDGALERDMYPIDPPPFRVAGLIYLNNVPKHGGGTVVWPNSARALRKLIEEHPHKYTKMIDLNKDLPNIHIGPMLETRPRRGEVLLFSPFTAHSGSMNTSDVPRFALRGSWGKPGHHGETMFY